MWSPDEGLGTSQGPKRKRGSGEGGKGQTVGIGEGAPRPRPLRVYLPIYLLLEAAQDKMTRTADHTGKMSRSSQVGSGARSELGP